MNPIIPILFLFMFSAVVAQTIPEVRISSEVVYLNVKIVGFAGDDVVILHSKGTTSVRADTFDLETLARAQARIEAEAVDRKKKTDAVAKADATRRAEAVAHGKSVEAAIASTERPTQPPTAPAIVKRRSAPVPSIAQLKAAFPPKSNGSVRVVIADKTSRNGQLIKGREDTIQYSVPSEDVWSWYRGSFQTTTAEAWPRTVEMVEKRIDEDMQKLAHIGGGESARVQAQQTQRWLQEVLVPYVNQWRALSR